jgi:hypothetical protein
MDTFLFQFCQRYQTWLGLYHHRMVPLVSQVRLRLPKVGGPVAERRSAPLAVRG